METSTKSSAINYGLYLGIGLALYTILCYAFKIELLVNLWIILLVLPVLIILIGIISSIKAKNIQNGYITFKEAFSSYFIPIAIGLMISTIISIIIFNFVDPEAAIALKEKIIDTAVQIMRNFDTPEEIVAQSLEQMEAEENMFSIGNQLWSLAKQLIGFSVVGLIVALILKRNPETQE